MTALAVAAARPGRWVTAVGSLLALAAWTKPNVVGIAFGVFAYAALRDRKALAQLIIGAFVPSVVIGAILYRASDGLFIEHLLKATGQPPDFALWRSQVGARLPFFLLPLGYAIFCAHREPHRRDVAIARFALIGAIAWTVLSLAKIGSASNYWLEPSLAAFVLVSRAGVAWPKGPQAAWAGLALVQTLYTGVATLRSAWEAQRDLPAKRAYLSELKASRGSASGSNGSGGHEEVIATDEAGLTFELNGRILDTPFQFTHLTRAGRFPEELFLSDYQHPEVTRLLMSDDLLERPLTIESVPHDRFSPSMRRALLQRFHFVEKRAGYFLYGVQ